MKTINSTDIKPFPGLEPKMDSNLIKLFKLSFSGNIATYFARIPINLIQPFDHDFHPQQHPVGKQMIAHMIHLIDQQHSLPMWVYPKDGLFVMSDDYCAYQAHLAVGTECLPCFILGTPKVQTSFKLIGPLSRKRVMRALGLVILGA